MTRREIREIIFMLLFQLEFHNEADIKQTLEQYMSAEENSLPADNEAVTKLFASLPESEIEYIRSVFHGVNEKRDEIDALIEKHTQDWSLERITKVDLAVLRYCVYELTYLSDAIPDSISINEAIELVKKYSTDKSRTFVNGVLAAYWKELKGNGTQE